MWARNNSWNSGFVAEPPAVRVRLEHPRGDGVHPHPAGRPVGGQGLRQCGQCRLGRLVVPAADALDRDRTGDRGHVHHRTPPRVEHRLADLLATDQGAGQVQVDQLPPLVEREVLGRHVQPPTADVVDQHVDRPAQCQRRIAGGAPPPPGVPTSPGTTCTVRPVAASSSPGGRQRVGVAADQDQVGPGLRQRPGHRPAQPPTAAGDQGRAAVEPEPVEDSHLASRPLAGL